jgi:hypothetical protein
MKVARELQRTILEACETVFPEGASAGVLKLSDDANHVAANLVYVTVVPPNLDQLAGADQGVKLRDSVSNVTP